MRSIAEVLGGTRAIAMQIGTNTIHEQKRKADVHATFRKRRTRFRVLEKRFELTQNVVYLSRNARRVVHDP